MKRKNWGLVVMLILVTAVIISSFFILKNKSIPSNSINKKSENNFLSNTKDNENINNKVTKEQTINKEKTKGNGVINTIKDVLGLGCEEKQITYSMINFNKTSICNVNQENICTDKTVICSVEIKNRDSETSGFFKIELTFAEEENKNNILNKSSSRFFLEPGEKNKFSNSINLQSTGINGIANKEINCFFNTIEIPKKEVC